MPKKRAPTTPERRALQPRADFEKRHFKRFKSAPTLKRFETIGFQIPVHFLSNATSKSAPSCSGFNRLTSKWASRHSRVQFMMEKAQHRAQKLFNVSFEIHRKAPKIDLEFCNKATNEFPARLFSRVARDGASATPHKQHGKWRTEKPQHRAQKRLNAFSEICRKVSKIDMIWKMDSKKEPPPRLEAGQWRAEKPQHRARIEEKSQRYRT